MADRLNNLFLRLSQLNSAKGLLGDTSRMSTTDLHALVERLEQVAIRLEKAEGLQCSGAYNMRSGKSESPSVQAYDAILNGVLKEYLRLSNAIGEEVQKQANMVQEALKLQRQFLEIASKSKEPQQNALVSLLKPTSEQIQTIQDYRQKNRSSKYFNHLSAISESISALGWVTVTPAPAPYVKEMSDASQFYTNRVLVDYKDKNKTHIDWARSWLTVLNELQAYVKDYHLTGLVWNPQGGDAFSATGQAGGLAGPPPPPPPPPADFLNDSAPAEEDPRAALFKEINKGEGISKGLKKVTADQQTHKNPALKAQSYKPSLTTPRPFKPASQSSLPTKPTKPPRLELEGKKWLVEYQCDVPQIVLDDVSMNQSVYVYQCINCVIIVKGKVNSISIDSCRKTAVVFEDIVSLVEFINCQSVKAQSLGKVPTIAVDKTDGVHIYLSNNSLDAEIVTSKCSEMNVSIPKPDGEYMEIPLPEQYKSVWNGKILTTIPLDKA